MPTYVYKFVETGETIEVQQAFTDDTLTEAAHPESGQVMPVKKVFQPVGVTFRGSGFFKTDNRGKSGSKADSGDAKSSGDTSKPSESKSSDTKSSESSKSSDSSKSDSSKSSSTSSASTPSD